MSSLYSIIMLLLLICFCNTKNLSNLSQAKVVCSNRCISHSNKNGKGQTQVCGKSKFDCCLRPNGAKQYIECDYRFFSYFCPQGTFAFTC